jgi:hypothetical protein
MERVGRIQWAQENFGKDDSGKDIVEHRPIAKIPPNLSYFSRDDLKFVEDSIRYYWNKTGTEASDDSHGIAWRSRDIKNTMYYELAYISDDELSISEKSEALRELSDIGIT